MTKRIDSIITDSKRITFPEHEILISFASDDAAIAFGEWWTWRGKTAFEEWVKAYGEPYEHLLEKIS